MRLDELLPRLACPACQSRLVSAPGEITCSGCARRYRVEDGIPILLVDDASAGHDELDHHHGHEHKRRQAHWFDREAAAEFEIERPRGSPELHRWLLERKFAYSVEGIADLLPDATALTVCGGSGMDAEFLERTGADVVASDISLGAAQRTQERARRHGLNVLPVVADVERLPFADRSFDLVYVHDGLHHLEDPFAGLREMARVADSAVSVTEPARAAVTRLAVRLGLAQEVEEAGNKVARLTLDDVEAVLRAAGLAPTHRRRYAMYYSHEPGRPTRWLSVPGLAPAAKAAWRTVNVLLGTAGNKMTVAAVRR